MDRPHARRRARLAEEEGVALVTVLGWSLVLMLLVVAVVGFATNGMRQAAGNQRWHAALAAAEAGVDDFVYRLNQDSAILQEEPDCDAAEDPEPRCGFVDAPGGASVGEYRYEVDGEAFAATGAIELVATGRVGEETRTVEATIRRETFIDYIYWTNFETVPPRFVAQNSNRSESWVEANCARHDHGTSRPSGCTSIVFGSQDVIDGPFHTNDTIRVDGSPTWIYEATSSDPRLASGSSYRGYEPAGQNPTFPDGDPSYRAQLHMPPSNDEVRKAADPDDTTGGAGCLYRGPTFVELDGDEMRVYSPRTTGNPGPGCPSGSGDRGSTPDNGVLYVDGTDTSCGGSHPFKQHHSSVGRIIPQDDHTNYSTCAGDLFIEGTVSGHLTASSANDIIITWHLEYENGLESDDDLLGLAAQGYVEVFRPTHRGCTSQSWWGGCRATSWQELRVPRHNALFRDARIEAAILAMDGAFQVQNVYLSDYGGQADLGDLTVNGAIIQPFRGAVALNASPLRGYAKDYNYDWRLRRLSPPHFIEPEQAQFHVVEWAERDRP